MMKFRSTSAKHREVEIPLTSLIDLFLNILVFFLVSTSFSQNKWISINLPKTQSGQTVQDQSILAIALDEQGKLYLNKQAIEKDALLIILKEQSNKSIPVILAADQNVSHGKVMDILDQVKISGLQNISVLSKD